jgi:hypothetical protein
MRLRDSVQQLPLVAATALAAAPVHAGVMGAGGPGGGMTGTIIVFLVGVVVGAALVYFFLRRKD